ncbi:hypothetical protein C0992_009961, partial [Termitomyces sp. T32_za158]
MTTLGPPAPLPLQSDIRVDLEPDKAWKDELRAKIEDSLSSMVEDAKKKYQTELSKGTASDALREAINHEYEETMNGIRIIAQETYMDGLQRERQERRWAAGVDMFPGWNEALVREQQDIMDRINKGVRKDTQSTSVAEGSMAERPIDDRHVVVQSSSPSGYSLSSHAQKGTMSRHLVKESRERSLDRLNQGLLTSQSPQPPSDPPATPEQQRQQEEKARRILERKEREKQAKADKEMEKLRKEEEAKERLKEQEHAKRMEEQLLEKGRQGRGRAEKDQQAREHLEEQRREMEHRWEREHLERLEAARIEEEREQKERWKREEEESEREKAREIQLQRDRQREYVQGTQ